jgi:transposase
MIPERGVDVPVFPTDGHFASLAGARLGHHDSAGRRPSRRNRPRPGRLTPQLTESAGPPPRTTTYLAAQSAPPRGRRAEPKGIGAVRHGLLVTYYPVVRDESRADEPDRLCLRGLTPVGARTRAALASRWLEARP